jgi:hypothetical protein
MSRVQTISNSTIFIPNPAIGSNVTMDDENNTPMDTGMPIFTHEI